MHYFSFQIPLFSSKLFSKREITRLLFFLSLSFFFYFCTQPIQRWLREVSLKPRGDVLLHHQDEARAVAFHVRSAGKQRVVGPNMARLSYWNVQSHELELILPLTCSVSRIYRARKLPLIAIKERGFGPRESTEVTEANWRLGSAYT